jgi:hypothetical protein
MFTQADLEDAVAAGVIPAESAAALRAHFDAVRATPSVDEEQFRLLNSFNDIFVSIAAVLLLISVAWIGGAMHLVIGALAVAGTSWGLAEYFTRVRRMALPSIILLWSFVVGVFFTLAFGLLGDQNWGGGATANENEVISLKFAVSAAVSAAAAWFHWQRFMVPITVAAGAAALVGMALALLLAAVPGADNWLMLLMFIAGIGVFIVAMRWDMSDQIRQTRRSDVAFWLHLLAAPLIVHPIFQQVGLIGSSDPNAGSAIVALGIYVVLGMIALIIDRRAIMVSALVYVLVAITVLFDKFGSISNGFAFTALVIGSALLMLSALWHRLRAGLVGQLPTGWLRYVPAV